jgi:hypothetical protein
VTIVLNDGTHRRFGTPSATCTPTPTSLVIDTCNIELKGFQAAAVTILPWRGRGLLENLWYYLESSVPGITISLSNIDH